MTKAYRLTKLVSALLICSIINGRAMAYHTVVAGPTNATGASCSCDRVQGMWGHSIKLLARTLALIALVTQALMPGSMAAASTHKGDPAAVICAMPGADMHGAGHVIGSDLAELLASKSSPAPSDTDHDCPACVIAQTATLPEPVVLKSPATGRVSQTAPVFEVRFAHVPRGPPVDSRAPPVSLKA